jgi:hypothetical protein
MILCRGGMLKATRILARLMDADVGLAGADQPVIACRHGRCHLLTLGYVAGAKGRLTRGIAAVHFLSPARADELIAAWLPHSRLQPFARILPAFREEFACKALPSAEDYRPWLRCGRMTVVGGRTTDTLRVSPVDAGQDRLVDAIAWMMREGPVGPYRHFDAARMA